MNPAKLLTLLFVLPITNAVVLGQSYPPAVEFQSLMNLRFYEANGGFLVEDLQLVFPPAGVQNAKFVITKTTGEVVDSVPLRFEAMEFPAFGRLRPQGHPGNVRVGAAGDYVMAVLIDGQPITQLPFSLKEQVSSDPFNPGSRFVREGPFRDLAYFSVLPDDPNGELQFNWWMSLRELPPGMKNPNVTIHLLVNGQEFAASRGPVIPTLIDWQFYQHRQLSVPSQPRHHWLTLSDLTKRESEITLVVKANGQPIKSYKTRVVGGQIQRLPVNSLNSQPRTAFISPRFIDTSPGSSSRYKMFEMYWVKRSEK